MAKDERERVGGSVKKAVAQRLHAEAEARVISEAVLIEKALEMYLPTLPPIPGSIEDAAKSAGRATGGN